MEAAALKQITDLAIEAAKENRLNPPGGKPAILIGEKVVSIEHLLPGRVRYRGDFNTKLPMSFAGYVKDNGSADHSAVYVNPEALSAVAILNQGTPENAGHCDWTASLSLAHTAGYAALIAVNGRQHSQRDLSAWLEDWSHMLSATYGGECKAIATAIAAIRSITFKAKDESSHTVSDYGARQSGLSEIEATSDAGRLPDYLEARVAPAQGLSVQTIRLRLSVITGDRPGLVLRIVGLEALQEAVALEFRSLLESLLDGAAPVHIGLFSP